MCCHEPLVVGPDGKPSTPQSTTTYGACASCGRCERCGKAGCAAAPKAPAAPPVRYDPFEHEPGALQQRGGGYAE